MSAGERTGGGVTVPERRWLVVRGQHTAVRVALPAFGLLRIGSAEACDVRVVEPGVAEEHAVIHLDPGIGAEVHDGDSGVTRSDPRKKTRAEEPLFEGSNVRLELGDELRLGSVALAFMEEQASVNAHRPWARGYFEVKLDELRRGDDAGDAILVRVRPGAAAEAGVLEQMLADHLEARDLICDLGSGELAVLLADAGEARARQLARGPFAELAAKHADFAIGMIGVVESRAAKLEEVLELAGARMSRLAQRAEAGPSIVVEDAAMKDVMRLVEQVAESASPVLVLGETGVGKDLIAQMVHERSSRALRPFVRVSCVDLAEESADDGRSAVRLPDVLARASGGTVLLDEVGGLSSRAQIALNNVIEAKEVRFVATSNHDLRAEVKRGAFRKDLFFRLNRLTISVPPLRARTAEIVPLAELFLRRHAEVLRRAKVPKLSREAKERLGAHVWPGNVRELENAIERALLMTTGEVIGAEVFSLESFEDAIDAADSDAPTHSVPVVSASAPHSAAGPASGSASANPPPSASKPTAASLREEMAALERARIIEALEQYPTQADAAKALDIPLRTFLNRLDALGIPRPRKARE